MLLHDKQIVALYVHFPPCPLPSTSNVLNMILYRRYSFIVFPYCLPHLYHSKYGEFYLPFLWIAQLRVVVFRAIR